MSDAPTPAKATPAVAFCFLANSVLAREKWARERLEPFAGQGFEVRLPLVRPLLLVIAAGGRIEPGQAPAAALVSPAGVAGDSALAEELRYLRRHLRPDVEEELSRVVGDIAAHQLVGTARSFMRWQRDALARVASSLADYAADERGALVRRVELADLGARVRELDEALARLENRVGRL